MAKVIKCGCGTESATLTAAIEHYMGGCEDNIPETLEGALAFVVEDIFHLTWGGRYSHTTDRALPWVNMLREWWGCHESQDKEVRGFADGIAFCLLELGFEVDGKP